MRSIYDLVDTRELIATVREVIERETENQLRAFLPYRNVEDIDYRFVRVNRTNHAAQIRAFDTPAQRGRRPGASERRGSLPSISEILDLSESERIRLRRIAGGDVGDIIAENVFSDAATAAMAVANRLELLRGEVLATGQIAIDEGGVLQTINYEVPAQLQVAAAVAWTDTANADIIGDLFTWDEAYKDHGNNSAGAFITSTRVRNLALRNAGIQRLVYGGNNVGQLVTVEQLNQVLAAHGLPTMVTYDRKVEDATGTEQRVIAEDMLIFVPGAGDAARRLGETQMGVTEEAVAAVDARAIAIEEAPGLVAVNLQQDHPVLTATLATCIGLPVLQQPDKVLQADVF